MKNENFVYGVVGLMSALICFMSCFVLRSWGMPYFGITLLCFAGVSFNASLE
jgi:hypothetical protein